MLLVRQISFTIAYTIAYTIVSPELSGHKYDIQIPLATIFVIIDDAREIPFTYIIMKITQMLCFGQEN